MTTATVKLVLRRDKRLLSHRSSSVVEGGGCLVMRPADDYVKKCRDQKPAQDDDGHRRLGLLRIL